MASYVLHATINLEQALSNLRKLLKPGGKLLLFEITSPDSIQLGFVFGLLRDWWAPLEHEQRSICSPCLTVDRWDSALKASGFSGVDLAIDAGGGSSQVGDRSIIISSNMATEDPLHAVKIIVDEHVGSQRSLAAALTSEHGTASCEVLTLPLATRAELKDAVLIVLLEVDSVFLHGISEANYNHLSLVLQQCQRVVWVTRWTLGRNPFHGMVDGLGRVLMSEDSNYKFSTLALDARNVEPAETAAVTSNVARQVCELPVENIDNFTSVDGVLHSLRITESRSMDKLVTASTSPWYPQKIPITGAMALELHIPTPGQLNTLEWREVVLESDRPTCTGLDDHEVMIQVRAIGLCSRDLAVAMGQYDASELGVEFSGIVLQAGAHSGFAPEDKVFAVSPRACASRMRMPAEGLVRMPPHMSFADAAAMPKALWMSYHGVVSSGRVESGETILVCEGASDVGQMAIRMAVRLRARVLAAVSSEQDRLLLETSYKLDPDDIFDAGDGGMVARILQRTRGNGVDVVMSVPQHGHASIDYTPCLATSGRLVRAGISSLPTDFEGKRSSHFPRPADLSVISFGMLDLFAAKPQKAHSILQHATAMAFGHGNHGPLQHVRNFDCQDLEGAFRHLKDGQGAGKSVIELGQTDRVTVCVVVLS